MRLGEIPRVHLPRHDRNGGGHEVVIHGLRVTTLESVHRRDLQLHIYGKLALKVIVFGGRYVGYLLADLVRIGRVQA